MNTLLASKNHMVLEAAKAKAIGDSDAMAKFSMSGAQLELLTAEEYYLSGDKPNAIISLNSALALIQDAITAINE